MAKLTNRQMDILAERVTDLLQDRSLAKNIDILNTPEYKNFDETFTDDLLAMILVFDRELKNLEEIKDRTVKQIEGIRANMINLMKKKGFEFPTWKSGLNPDEAKSLYLAHMKKKHYEEIEFDYAKTLRKVTADILLADTGNAEELVNSLVSKYEKAST